uniref:Coatomer subunit epsilon n=1 Tax=Florenciella parvula TaxID=236787 RepID=A0A7S2F9R0_9STRA|eukprot:CAMPEP_0182534778 /NCGR_PEP_ID=MMETSP1323-20130603/16478_1 /TAXON_ID=236787 /ORGANISM="Florenciella parvula, Strain RCC1693" /LENGTH=297 /DNA_ID=CAMNT_0024744833 /DNA_START=54 /DNA_END=947 /DNA_ORIENTATION=+
MAEPDDLYTLRTLFWLGNYQRVPVEASSLNRLPEALRIEVKEFVYRSYIAMGQHSIVLDEIKDAPGTPVSLQAVKLLARYLSDPSSKELVLMTLGEWLADPGSAGNSSLQLIAAVIYMHENNTKDALKTIRHGTTMEQLALNIQIYLKMDRPDLATKQVRLMQQADEDATLTQLSLAWTYLATGGKKLQEAAFIYEELIDKFGPTTSLLNGVAVANMHMGKFDEAEKTLQNALQQGPNDPDTLVNLISCYQHLSKPSELIQRHINQLRSGAPNNPMVQQLNTVEGAFDRVAGTYALN